MTQTQRTMVVFLLDRSGSMEQIRADTIGAFNVYLDTLKEGPGAALIDFTFLQFDSEGITKLTVDTPVRDVARLTTDNFVPRGNTPLIDACAKTLAAIDKRIAERGDAPKVVVCFHTDGEENCSIEYTWEQLKELVLGKQAQGWQFNFMGAGIDAYQQASRMGIAAGQTVSYNKMSGQHTDQSFAASASNARRFSAGTAANTDFSAQQKSASGDVYAGQSDAQADAAIRADYIETQKRKTDVKL